MANIINKRVKRRCIALSCINILTTNSIKDLTISQLAKEANIGKGTIYEYFLDKEDIVLELSQALYEEYKQISSKKIASFQNAKDKIYCSFTSLYDEEFLNHRKILNIFMGICHYRVDDSYKRFKKRLYKDHLSLFLSLIKYGIKKENPKNLSKILLNSYTGFFITFLFYNDCKKTKKEIRKFLEYVL